MSAYRGQAAWQLPVQWPEAEAPAARATRHATRLLQAGIVFAMLALTLLDRFGRRISADDSIPPGTIALYVLVGLAFVTASGALNGRVALAYLVVACVSGLSY